MPRLRLDMTLKELIDKLTSDEAPNPNATAGWVNIRKDGFPWRHMVMDAEGGRAEVSRVGRKLMARESEVDRWLSSKQITGPMRREREPTRNPEHPSDCDCARCYVLKMHEAVSHALGHIRTPLTEAELQAKVAEEEEDRRIRATPEYQAREAAREAAHEATQQSMRNREQADREARQERALAYLAKHPSITATKHVEINKATPSSFRVTLHRAMRDLNDLVATGKLRREGKSSTGRYFPVAKDQQ